MNALDGQLFLFELPTPNQPKRKRPTPAIAKKSKTAGLYSIEPNGEYYTVRYRGTWIGSLYHLGGKVWNLYFPNEHWVCGFGGPNQVGAAEELYRRYAEEGKQVPL